MVWSKNMFLTLEEYLLGAKKILNIYGYPCHKKDDDAISFVAYYMMKADQTWDGVSSSKTTWRFNQARYAILKLRAKYRKQKKHISLNKVISEKAGRSIILSDVIADQKTKAKDSFELAEVMNLIEQKLSDRQKECVLMYYVDGLNLEEVGKKLGITKQAVSLNIKKSIEKIKNECQSEDYNYVN